ncbi:dicer-like protein 1 [Elysia marginata]|uniref:Dicer-like protein 1 n=1 Tax=Elysia marginata TaxID=1093978 RepID=A0AAV4HLH1_9GAST|nr:dicer-like protein 1 [Elysia marginata]
MAESGSNRLTITEEESKFPVWQQVQTNGSLRWHEIEIRDASLPEDVNDLNYDTRDDNFSDDDSSDEEESGEDLKLREYQKELAEVALTGRNCVICAPTGSGKTKVAVYIILEHLKRYPEAKVAFFARTVPLAKQQYQTIKNHLPGNNEILLMSGESENSMSLHKLLPAHNVVVLTPMILVNHLRGKRPLLTEGIAVFTLLVFDECHHTREGEPYNNIMEYYLKEKRQKRKMPQVVGLTASIGVEKAKDEETAENNIMRVCGNLDVDHLATVKRNKEELKRIVPVPREQEFKLVENEVNAATLKILDVVKEMENMAAHNADDGNDDNVKAFMECVPPSKKHPEYCQWVQCLNKAAKLVRVPDVHLKDVAERHEANVNPNLEILADTLRRHVVQRGKDARAIVFVKTRMLAEAVSSWLCRCGEDDLMGLNAKKFTSTQKPEELGGMTESQQKAALNEFQSGKVRVLVATSVGEEGLDIPQCNLVVKYNHTGNEYCPLCKRISVESSEIRTIYEKYRVSIDRELLNHIKIVPYQEWSMDELSFVGSAICLAETEPGKKCSHKIGNVIKHKGCPFVALGIKKRNLVFQCNGEAPRAFKQWSEVPYVVEELSQEDMLVYAMT